jgi:RimJ/RimL family protein N-acetyltransferase
MIIEHDNLLYISDIVEEDLPQILDIRNHPDTLKYLHTPVVFNLDQCKKWFHENNPMWFSIKEKDTQKIVGYFRTSNLDYDKKSLYVGCDIHPQYRRMKIATWAYSKVTKMLIERGWNLVGLKVLKTNTAALNLYYKIGFKNIGEDDLSFLMEKEIKFDNHKNNCETNVLVSKRKNAIDIDSGIFIIGAWADTKEKEDVLKENIQLIRNNFDTNIILVSHLPIIYEIQLLVDYFIYDKNNPLLYNKDFGRYGIDSGWWYEDSIIRVDRQIPFRHDYAILLSMKNAFHFAKYLEKKYIFYLEYDCTINVDDFKREFIFPLKTNDYEACIDVYGNQYCATGYFSIETDLAVEIIDMYKTQSDFFNNLGFGFEQFFFRTFLKKVKNKFYSVNYKDINYQVNRFTICDRFTNYGAYFIATPVLDLKGDFYIFFDNIFKEDVYLNLEFLNIKRTVCLKNGYGFVEKICHVNDNIKIKIFYDKNFVIEYDTVKYKDTYELNKVVFK